MLTRKHAWILILLAMTAPLLAQKGDRKGQAMPEVWRDMNVPAAPPLSPEQALKSFAVDPAFELQLVAAEPLVEDPVAITWDEDGRLWAVEMRGYMPNVDGTGEDVRNGRIVTLEDRDGDGRMDRSTVFLDQLQMPRAVAIVNGGVLVAEPPTLWFCRDTNGDGACDEKTKVADYAKQGPVEHTDNGLLLALDNRIYNAKSSRVFTWDGKAITEHESIGRGQWGIMQDDFGRLYYNSNSSYLHVDTVPAEYYLRNPHAPARLGLGSRVVSDQSVWSIRVNPGINRGYQQSMLKSDGRLARTTAVSGGTIYRGDRYPKAYRGNAFVPEPSGNVVSRFVLQDDGLNVKGEKQLVKDPKWMQREFLASTDERFRPVSAYTGPDGCLYVVDMYRGILQHKAFVTTFLRAQIIERKLDTPIGMGRIYRLVHKKTSPDVMHPKLSGAPSSQLVDHLAHDNGWYRDTAQRLLVDRAEASSIEPLRKVARDHANPLARIHALWTLEGLHAIDVDTTQAALRHTQPRVRIAALQTAELGLRDSKTRGEFLKAITDMLKRERDSSVLTHAAFTLGEAADLPDSRKALSTLLFQNANDPVIRAAILSGLRQREIIFMAELTGKPDFKGRNLFVAELATTVFRSRSADDIPALLTLATTDEALQEPILQGAAKARDKRYKAVELSAAPTAIDTLKKAPQPNM